MMLSVSAPIAMSVMNASNDKCAILHIGANNLKHGCHRNSFISYVGGRTYIKLAKIVLNKVVLLCQKKMFIQKKIIQKFLNLSYFLVTLYIRCYSH